MINTNNALLGRAGGVLYCLNFKMFYHCANKYMYMKDACFWKGRVPTGENFGLFALVCCHFILCNFILHLFKKKLSGHIVISISIPNKVRRKYQLEVVKLMLHKF